MLSQLIPPPPPPPPTMTSLLQTLANAVSDAFSGADHSDEDHLLQRTQQIRRRITLPASDRYVIVNMCCQGYSPSKIAKALTTEERRVPTHTVRGVLRLWRQTNRIEPKKRGGTVMKYSEEERKVLADIQNEHHTYTYEQLRKAWKERTGSTKKLSDGTINRILKQFDITTKNVYYVPAERNTPANIEKRRMYAEQAIAWDAAELLFVDESGFNLHIRRSRGRSTSGTKAVWVAPNARGRNVSIIGVLSPKYGMIFWKKYVGGTDAQRYTQFLTELLREPRFQYKTYRIVMDNATCHSKKQIEELLEGQPVRQIAQFLPPYSPHLNPIENAWGHMKQHIAKKERVAGADMFALIQEAMSHVTPDKCDGWYRDCVRKYVDCIQGKPLE